MKVTDKNPQQNIFQKTVYSNLKLLCCCNFMRKRRHIPYFFSPPNLKNIYQFFGHFAPKISKQEFCQLNFVILPNFQTLCCCTLYKKSEKLNASMHQFVMESATRFKNQESCLHQVSIKLKNLILCRFWAHIEPKTSKLKLSVVKTFKSILNLCHCNFMQQKQKFHVFVFDNT